MPARSQVVLLRYQFDIRLEKRLALCYVLVFS